MSLSSMKMCVGQRLDTRMRIRATKKCPALLRFAGKRIDTQRQTRSERLGTCFSGAHPKIPIAMVIKAHTLLAHVPKQLDAPLREHRRVRNEHVCLICRASHFQGDTSRPRVAE